MHLCDVCSAHQTPYASCGISPLCCCFADHLNASIGSDEVSRAGRGSSPVGYAIRAPGVPRPRCFKRGKRLLKRDRNYLNDTLKNVGWARMALHKVFSLVRRSFLSRLHGGAHILQARATSLCRALSQLNESKTWFQACVSKVL